MKDLTFFLVDDDADDREIFTMALKNVNREAKCITADDCGQAVEKLRKDPDFKPDYIFLDINMPKMNGMECLSEIKKIARHDGVPVYMYSTSAEPQVAEESKRLGAADFIKKQVNIRELERILSGILAGGSMNN